MTAQGKINPRKAAGDTLERLRSKANKAKAASYQRFFKEPVEFFGLDSKGAHHIKQDLLERVEGSWTIDDAIQFCRAMVRDPHMEARGIGYQVVAHFISEAPPELSTQVRRWLERACGNWGLVDNLAPSVLGPLIELHPKLISEVVSWTDSPNLWVRRGAVVAFVPLVSTGKKKHVDSAYRVASRLFDDKEDLIHKAVGWLLREAGKSDMERLERFLIKNGPKVPRTSVRYAIERFPKNERKRLLEVTRATRVNKARK